MPDVPQTLWLLPGTLCRRELFAPVVRRLRPDVQVRSLNWPAARRLLAQPGNVPLNLAGFSLGGIAALGLLRAHPERIARLALIASNAEGAGPVARRRGQAQRRRLARGGTRAMLAAALPGYFRGRPRPHWQRAVTRMAVATRPADARTQIELACRRPASHAPLAAFSGPLAVIAGTHDRLCPPALQRRLLTAQPAARSTFIPRCGHFLPLEAPAQLANALRVWLRTPLESLA